MAERKSQDEVTAVIKDVYGVVRKSASPLSQLGMKVSALINNGWIMDDTERVAFGVIEALLRSRGWKYLSELGGKKMQRASG